MRTRPCGMLWLERGGVEWASCHTCWAATHDGQQDPHQAPTSALHITAAKGSARKYRREPAQPGWGRVGSRKRGVCRGKVGGGARRQNVELMDHEMAHKWGERGPGVSKLYRGVYKRGITDPGTRPRPDGWSGPGLSEGSTRAKSCPTPTPQSIMCRSPVELLIC